MSAKSESNIKYPYEYIAAQVEFGVKVVAVTKLKPTLVFNKYTNLYGTLSNHRFADKKEYKWVKGTLAKLDEYVTKIKDPKKLSDKVYKLYLKIPLEKHAAPADETLHFGCFRLNNSAYYQHRKEVRLHFSPIRAGLKTKDKKYRTSDLAAVYMPKRRAEFKKMIKFIYKNPQKFGKPTHFVSSSWLQNLAVYQSFFPKITARNKSKVEHGHWWYWGQFLKWDLTGNSTRLDELRANLVGVKTLEQATNAIPLQIYTVKIPIKSMYKKYIK